MQTLEDFKAYVDERVADLLEELHSYEPTLWARSPLCLDLLRDMDEFIRVLTLVDGFQASASAARGYGGCAPHGDQV